MKRIAVVYSEYSPTVDAIIAQLKDVEVTCFKGVPEGEYDLIVNINGATTPPTPLPHGGQSDGAGDKVINVHYSLLPAFKGDEPVKQAVLAGVKVTGITFYFTNPERIIAQYPVFISNTSHFDDVEKELQYLEQTIYPIVIEKLLNNEPFELKNLLQKGCGGCSGCTH